MQEKDDYPCLDGKAREAAILFDRLISLLDSHHGGEDDLDQLANLRNKVVMSMVECQVVRVKF